MCIKEQLEAMGVLYSLLRKLNKRCKKTLILEKADKHQGCAMPVHDTNDFNAAVIR
jgi:hypothetical protein